MLAKEHTGPLKSLDAAQAEEEATGKDENERLEGGDDDPDDEPEAEPEGEPEVEAPPAEEPEPEEEPEESGEAVLAKIDEVLKLLGQKEAAKATETPAEKETELAAPPHIQRLLDSEDPGIRDTGEAMLVEYRARETDRIEREDRERVATQEQVAAAYDAKVDSVGAACDPPLTEKEKDQLVEYLTSDRNGRPLLASLTVDEGAQLRFPGRLKATNGKTDTAPKGAEGSRPVIDVRSQRPEKGTIDDRGGSAGPKPTHQNVLGDKAIPTEDAVERGYAQITGRSRR
jgi:hypothetical protein